MLQTATINYNSPSHAGLAAIHPSNAGNINGRVLSRSPTSNFIDIRNLSPNKLNATKKPMLGNNGMANNVVLPAGFAVRRNNNMSPNNKVSNLVNFGNGFHNYQTNPVREPLLNSKGIKGLAFDKSQFCQNHVNKPAEFVAQLQNQNIGYCQKCAINLASKGFSVTRKSDLQPESSHKPSIFDKHRLQPFHSPHFAHLPGYSDLQALIHNIDKTHSAYLTQIHKCQTIEQHYDQQYEMTQQFYQSLLNLVQQMKIDHLADLQNQAKKHHQLALIKEDHLKSDVQEMEIIRSDLVNSQQIILQDFNSSVVQTNINFYKQQVYTYKDKIEDESAEFAKTIIDEKGPELKQKLKKIEDYLIDVWNDKHKNEMSNKQKTNHNQPLNHIHNNLKVEQRPSIPAVQQKSPRSVKHLLNLQPKIENETKKTAYRQLFEDENENVQQQRIGNDLNMNDHTFNNEELSGQKSPQFKNI